MIQFCSALNGGQVCVGNGDGWQWAAMQDLGLRRPIGWPRLMCMDYSKIITIEPGKRSGKPCIRGLRITVYDVLDYLAAEMTEAQILADFTALREEDIRACLAFAAD